MPTLHVRNVPEGLYEQIRQQAEAQNRSISAEVITLLQRAIESRARSQDEVLDNIRRRRFFRPDDAGTPDCTTPLRQDRGR